MAFVLTPQDGRDDRCWWGGCAWDTFGISAALQLDVRIDTACLFCVAAHISVETGPATPPPEQLAVRFPRPAAEEHAEWWTRDHASSTGYISPARAVWKLAGP
ncbi:uncharacterized protein J3D65DRAFT_672591 [Phyllosticta citribraziliensis]|uniref:Uncharacterized protein n=1 Tax=Phyllosticta citribraziliensis TaxID=989973 RepID=A0ABR1L773_9PEZI